MTRTLNISYLKAVPVGESTTTPFQILNPPPFCSSRAAYDGAPFSAGFGLEHVMDPAWHEGMLVGLTMHAQARPS